MARYILIKPYSARVVVGGFVGISDKSFVQGETIVGTKKPDGVETRIAAPNKEGLPSNLTHQEFLTIPYEYLKEQKSVLTTKNVVITLLIVVVLFTLFKITKTF